MVAAVDSTAHTSQAPQSSFILVTQPVRSFTANNSNQVRRIVPTDNTHPDDLHHHPLLLLATPITN